MKPAVLIVDDSLTVRMDLVEVFEEAGFEARGCGSIAEARQALAERDFAVAVLDVELPDGDGISLLQELKERSGPSTPVMLLTTRGEVEDRIKGIATGADEYVGKPYDAAQIVARARELVKAAAPGEDETGGRSLLVIDDSLTFREELRTALEDAGYHVTTAGSGEAGLKLAASLRPAGIVVDGTLPGIGGAEVIRRVRLDAALRQTPCLLLTGSMEEEEERRVLDAGADAFLVKSDGFDMLLARLRAMLRHVAPPGTAEAVKSLGAPQRVLAIDDSVTYLESVAEQLRFEGYDVVTAQSGEQGLELLEVQPVDCILLDLVMPGMSGQEACRKIKSRKAWRDIPLLILSAREEQDAMIGGINAGADDYITKSSEFDVLKARLRAQLRRKQIEDEHRRVQEQLLRSELEAAEARAARALAETRARLVAELERKNEELALTNADLSQAKELAERQSQFKSRFLASMSHELRTPLNAIIGFSELLREETFGPLNPTQSEYVQNVLVSGRHLLGLINEILDLSKVEAGRMDLQRQWMSLPAVADTVRSIAKPLASNRGVTLEFDVPDTLPQLYADPMRLKQILYNLLSNAIKFTGAGGRVRLEVRRDAAALRIEVADTGKGIRQDDIPKLFREFERLDAFQDGNPDGTGLGLVLTQRLVEMHGGTIEVKSSYGEGSSFIVRLPVLAQEEFEWISELRHNQIGPPRVLVVEDDEVAARLIAEYLRGTGLAVSLARDGEEAVRMARQIQPAAVTLDILMAGIDGWSILRQLRELPETAAIPVIVISAVDQPNRGLLLGATDYLVKPVSRDELLQSFEAIGIPRLQAASLRVLLLGEEAGEAEGESKSEPLTESSSPIPPFAPSSGEAASRGVAPSSGEAASRGVAPSSGEAASRGVAPSPSGANGGEGRAAASLESLARLLRNAGSEVTLARSVPRSKIATFSLAMVAQWCFDGEGARAVTPLIEKLRDASVPILGLSLGDPPDVPEWLPGVARAPIESLLKPYALLQCVCSLLHGDLRGTDFWHAPTGLPSPTALAMHLRTRVGLASRELKRLSLVRVEVALPTTAAPEPWARSLRRHLRPGDLVAVSDPGALALVAYDATRAMTGELTEKLCAHLEKDFLLTPGRRFFATYPKDGKTAEALLAHVAAGNGGGS